jgi:hypothetical protein
MKEDDANWPLPDRVGKQELEIVLKNEHISFTTAKIGSLLDVQSSKDPEGLRVFYYLVQVCAKLPPLLLTARVLAVSSSGCAGKASLLYQNVAVVNFAYVKYCPGKWMGSLFWFCHVLHTLSVHGLLVPNLSQKQALVLEPSLQPFHSSL